MPGWRIFVWVAVVTAALVFIYCVRGILLPFIVAFIVAALLEPAVNKVSVLLATPLRKLKAAHLSRPLSIAVVIFGFFFLVGGAAVLVTPRITRETQSLADRAQQLATSISRQGDNDDFFIRWNPALQVQQKGGPAGKIDQLLSKYSPELERFGLPSTRREIMEQYVDKNRPQITKAVQSFSNSAFGILTGLFSQLFYVFLVPLLVWLILSDMDVFRKQGPKFIPPAIRGSTMAIFADIEHVFMKYLRGITTVVLIYGAVMTCFLGIMGVPSWILLGPVFAALYLIPYVGNILSGLIVFCVIGFSGATGAMFHPFASAWSYGLLVTGLYFSIGLVFDHLIYPKMVGNSVGLSPVVSMFVIFCGEALFGLPGMLIAFPLAGSVKIILDRVLQVTSVDQEVLKLPTVPLRHRTS